MDGASSPFMDQLVLFRNFWTPRGNGHGAGTYWLTGGAFNGEKVPLAISVDQLAADISKERPYCHL